MKSINMPLIRKFFIDLLEISTSLYNNFSEELYLKEQELLNSLTLKELEVALSNLERLYVSSNNSIFDDLNTPSKKEVYERIKYNLNIRYMNKVQAFTMNGNSNILFKDFSTNELLSNELETRIRCVFLDLLINHLNSSNEASEEYKNYIMSIISRINFKYKNNFKPKTVHINMSIDDKEYIESSYIDELIMKTIKKISNYKDKELEEDNAYADSMCYHMLLRSLFVLLNDYNRLAYYNEIFNKHFHSESTSKGIIKSAFISNYIDLEKIRSNQNEFNRKKKSIKSI